MLVMDAIRLKSDLLALFKQYDLSVAVGLTKTGVAIRSQDIEVDAINLGEVVAYDSC